VHEHQGLAVGRIDIPAVNVARPTIRTDVHAEVSGLQRNT
jgi:hypothetical protein